MIDENKLFGTIKENSYLISYDRNSKEMGMTLTGIKQAIEEAPKIGEWIPVTYHETTPDDDIDMNEYPLYFDCHMPDDGQEILITTKRGYVEKDVCYIDDGFSLDSGYDWIEDVEAWMPLPDPYKPKNS